MSIKLSHAYVDVVTVYFRILLYSRKMLRILFNIGLFLQHQSSNKILLKSVSKPDSDKNSSMTLSLQKICQEVFLEPFTMVLCPKSGAKKMCNTLFYLQGHTLDRYLDSETYCSVASILRSHIFKSSDTLC